MPPSLGGPFEMYFAYIHMAQANYGGRRPAPQDCYRHAHCARSTCHYCAGAWYPEAREARLNDRAAASLSDYIESSM